MRKAVLLLVAVLTLIAVEGSIKDIDESRKVTVVISDPENSLISYECGLEAELSPGYGSVRKIAELKNRMAEEVVITYSQHFWVQGGENIRFIGADVPVSLQPLESKEVMGGFIVGEHARGGKLYFVFTATWPNGSAVIKTSVCPLEINVESNARSAWAVPEEYKSWDDVGLGGYFYYGGGDARVPMYISRNNQVGWLEITSSDNITTVCFNLTGSGYIIEKASVMAKDEEITEKDPENYPYIAENIGQESFCFEIDGFSQGYVAAHAVVR